MVTFNTVKDAVGGVLAQTWPDWPVYDERMSQGFKEPCFFVLLLPSSHEKIRDNRYQRSHSFVIHYFHNESYEALHAMAEQLYSLMDLIPFGAKPIRGKAMSHSIVDGVLQFYVRYDFHVLQEQPPGVKMQKMNQEGWLK